ncbi:MAG TPA: hypothetical protein VF116_07630 [Ktedonobacterales bacterium]
MAAVTTERLMQIALEMAGMSEVPPDSRVEYAGTRISHILFGIDVGPAELFMARQLGFHAVIAQRPYAIPAHASRSLEWQVDKLRELGASDQQVRGFLFHDERAARLAALGANQDVMPSTARLLDMPLVTIALPLDELARRRLQQLADDLTASHPEATAGDLRQAIRALPEFAAAREEPWLAATLDTTPLGTVLVLPGGLLPPWHIQLLAFGMFGIGTIVVPTLGGLIRPGEQPPADFLFSGNNVLVTGRIATASLGANSYIARLRAEGLEVRTFAGVLPPEQ